MTRQPLSARGVIASTLLGTDPPRLPGRLLVAIGEPFAIPSGTMRVALSRMVERGELANVDGTYELRGELLQRQERQNRTRRSRNHHWDGSWQCAIVTASGRTASDRAQLRTVLASLGLGERREGVWMRPDNLEEPGPTAAHLAGLRAIADQQVEWYRIAPLNLIDAQALARSLFPLHQWSKDALTLAEELEASSALLAPSGDRVAHPLLAEAFLLDAAARRLFLHDPRLPCALEPEDWPAPALDRAFRKLDRNLGLALRAFFKAVPRR